MCIKQHHEPDPAATWETGFVIGRRRPHMGEKVQCRCVLCECVLIGWGRQCRRNVFLCMWRVQMRDVLGVTLCHPLRPHDNVTISQCLSTCHARYMEGSRIETPACLPEKWTLQSFRLLIGVGVTAYSRRLLLQLEPLPFSAWISQGEIHAVSSPGVRKYQQQSYYMMIKFSSITFKAPRTQNGSHVGM